MIQEDYGIFHLVSVANFPRLATVVCFPALANGTLHVFPPLAMMVVAFVSSHDWFIASVC